MTPLFKKNKDQERLKGELTEEFEGIVQQLPLKTRVIAFYYDFEEYKDEMEELRVGARFASVREDLRVAYVTDKTLIKKMKRKHPDWFEKVGFSSLVLKRYDGRIVKFDITSGDKLEYANWINKSSMKPVEEYSNVVQRQYEMLRQPILMAFTDSSTKEGLRKTNSAIRVFEKIQPKYSHVIGFVHTDISKWADSRLKTYGISKKRPFPQLAFSMMDSRVLTYPQDQPIAKDDVMKWLDDAFVGKVQATYEKESEIVDIELAKLLNYTINVTPETYVENVFEEGIDTLVFYYSSENINDQQRNVAFQYNIMANALDALKIKTVRACSYDVNQYVYPDSIDYTLGLPVMYFYPAYKKTAPFTRYNGEGHAGTFLNWIQKHADIPIKYPMDVSRIGSPKTEEEIQKEKEFQERREQQAREEARKADAKFQETVKEIRADAEKAN